MPQSHNNVRICEVAIWNLAEERQFQTQHIKLGLLMRLLCGGVAIKCCVVVYGTEHNYDVMQVPLPVTVFIYVQLKVFLLGPRNYDWQRKLSL